MKAKSHTNVKFFPEKSNLRRHIIHQFMKANSVISENKGDESFPRKAYKSRILFKSTLVKHQVTVHGGNCQKVSYFLCNFSIFHEMRVTLLIICRSVEKMLHKNTVVSRFFLIFQFKKTHQKYAYEQSLSQ